MRTAVWQGLALVYIATFCTDVLAQKLTSKQWLHSHCKAYKADYTPLISRFLLRYQAGIRVEDVLHLQHPPGRSAQKGHGARPVVYLVNNTLHYADNQLATMIDEGHWFAGFSAYFMPVITRCIPSTNSLCTDA